MTLHRFQPRNDLKLLNYPLLQFTSELKLACRSRKTFSPRALCEDDDPRCATASNNWKQRRNVWSQANLWFRNSKSRNIYCILLVMKLDYGRFSKISYSRIWTSSQWLTFSATISGKTLTFGNRLPWKDRHHESRNDGPSDGKLLYLTTGKSIDNIVAINYFYGSFAWPFHYVFVLK